MANIPGPHQNQAGPSNRPVLRLLDFRAVRKNTMRGFAAIRLPNRLTIHDLGRPGNPPYRH
jgi:hypothetical protein